MDADGNLSDQQDMEENPEAKSKASSMQFVIPLNYENNTRNDYEGVIASILADSREINEPLTLLPKPIFDPGKKIDRLDVPDSFVLRLAYSKPKVDAA